MRNKILILSSNPKEVEELEKILERVIEEGGELFIAQKKEDALSILQKEHPQLAFIDPFLFGKEVREWQFEKTHFIFIRKKNDKMDDREDFILKPFSSHQILEKCSKVLSHGPVSKIPPI